ncbi:MAG: electron transfer flavoprotein subunit alpha/FixB family protein, partial [Bacteroidia bacterium]|nr:electron transfer flavoprotein subunit alpha/FixB family protein [Bacteroidia bacterium]
GQYGVDKVLSITHDGQFNAKIYAHYIKQAADHESADTIIIGSSADSRYLAPILAVGLNAVYASNVVAIPTSTSPFTVKRNTFTNKAYGFTEMKSQRKLIGLSSNSFGLVEKSVSVAVESFAPTTVQSSINVQSVDKAGGKVSIADADIVVSGGRGLKGPENWGMIEELAEVLGAATACSKPVSDLGWRPHSEHVGQTGKPVASNLYIAIGISGAIQHLAGVSASKVKVVINTDAEAPFFKAADYGVVGDAFEVVPKLIEKLKEFKAKNA